MCKRKENAFIVAINELDTLTKFQKCIIQERYIVLIQNFEKRAFFYSVLFHLCRVLVTIGSLIVPALLSIQYTDTSTTNTMNPEDFAYQIYWATWVVSLLVTTSNGIFTLFKIDKKYYFLHSTLELLRSEGWQYLELSGRFSGFYTPKEKATHSNQFLYFCHTVEKIKMRQVQEEYWKFAEAQSSQSKDSATVPKKDSESTAIEINSTSESAQTNTEISTITKQTHIPTFMTEGLLPPTPLNPTLQQLSQLLQTLSVDGQAQIQNQNQNHGAKMPVQSKVQGTTTSENGLLRQSSETLPKTESFVRMGTEISTPEMESKSKTQENT